MSAGVRGSCTDAARGAVRANGTPDVLLVRLVSVAWDDTREPSAKVPGYVAADTPSLALLSVLARIRLPTLNP